MILIERGCIKYTDTDSILTNVEIPSSKKLGEMKDEYPGSPAFRHGERMKGTFLQPKVYILEKESPFAKEHLASCTDKKCPGCNTIKIAMKGLPKKERTHANLIFLTTCIWCQKKIGYDPTTPCTAEGHTEEPCEGGTVGFTRLEKVRTLASNEFARPPQITDVKKRIVAAYDKRIILANGTTRAIRLSLGPEENEEPQERMQEAAE